MAEQRQIRIAVKNPRFTPGMQTRDIALFRLFDLGPRLRLIQSAAIVCKWRQSRSNAFPDEGW